MLPPMPAHNTTGDIDTVDDLLAMLDAWLQGDAEPSRWDFFYAQRERPCPFFVDCARRKPGRLAGRRAHWPRAGTGLGLRPWTQRAVPGAAGLRRVDAVDLSPTALAWAAERAGASGLPASARTTLAMRLGVFNSPRDRRV